MRSLVRTLGILSALSPVTLVAQADTTLSSAVAAIERVNALRSSLAGAFRLTGAPAGPEAFAEVCKPVGQTLQQTSVAHGWTSTQLATRYRNPANAPDAEAARVLAQFGRDSSLVSMTLRTTQRGQTGHRYLRRITVEESCLLCHGAKALRPAFITSKYPQDRAYGFRVGDLRGAYSVFIPDRADRR